MINCLCIVSSLCVDHSLFGGKRAFGGNVRSKVPEQFIATSFSVVELSSRRTVLTEMWCLWHTNFCYCNRIYELNCHRVGVNFENGLVKASVVIVVTNILTNSSLGSLPRRILMHLQMDNNTDKKKCLQCDDADICIIHMDWQPFVIQFNTACAY